MVRATYQHLRKIGYEQSEGNPCEWRKLDRRNREIIAESYVLIFVDDILHYYNGVGIEGKSIRDKLHEDLCKNGLPPLNSHELSAKNSITFLELSVQQLSQSGYTQAIITGHQYRKKQRSPLPADFNSRKIPDEKNQLLDEKGKSAYLQQLMRIAWLTHSRPDLSATLLFAHKQTRCAAPRVIDLEDLAHIVG